jgi:hypothetical protein
MGGGRGRLIRVGGDDANFVHGEVPCAEQPLHDLRAGPHLSMVRLGGSAGFLALDRDESHRELGAGPGEALGGGAIPSGHAILEVPTVEEVGGVKMALKWTVRWRYDGVKVALRWR